MMILDDIYLLVVRKKELKLYTKVSALKPLVRKSTGTVKISPGQELGALCEVDEYNPSEEEESVRQMLHQQLRQTEEYKRYWIPFQSTSHLSRWHKGDKWKIWLVSFTTCLLFRLLNWVIQS